MTRWWKMVPVVLVAAACSDSGEQAAAWEVEGAHARSSGPFAEPEPALQGEPSSRALDEPESAVLEPPSIEDESEARSPAREPEPLPSAPALDALCTTFVKSAKKDLPRRVAALMFPETHRSSAPWCRVLADSPAFAGDRAYRSLHAVRVHDGIVTESRLAIETARGLELTPIGWDRDDPQDPGCGVIAREREVESAIVDRDGRLIVTLLASRSFHYSLPGDELDDTYSEERLRMAWFCKDDGAALRCEWIEEDYERVLGVKAWSGRGEPREPSWDAIPWTNERAFTFDEHDVPSLSPPR